MHKEGKDNREAAFPRPGQLKGAILFSERRVWGDLEVSLQNCER